VVKYAAFCDNSSGTSSARTPAVVIFTWRLLRRRLRTFMLTAFSHRACSDGVIYRRMPNYCIQLNRTETSVHLLPARLLLGREPVRRQAGLLFILGCRTLLRDVPGALYKGLLDGVRASLAWR